MILKSSEKKLKQIEEYVSAPLSVGDRISYIDQYNKKRNGTIKSIKPLEILAEDGYLITYAQEITRIAYEVGVDPFAEYENLKTYSFPLDGIISQLRLEESFGASDTINGLEILECNLDPVVKTQLGYMPYQRPACWTLEDKQNLIKSICNYVDCGKILIRLRSLKESRQLHKDGQMPSFRDVVDGKQRLIALAEFYHCGFPDFNGDYYDDWSNSAQRKFRDSRAITYTELPENSSDESVLRQFLKMNFSGVPQSKEHLEYVESLHRRA